MYDLVIKNGKIVDGTASPAFCSDIAIENGKIVKIERNIKGESRKVIDANGLTVTPGFIDSHSHSDNAISSFPDMVEKIEQGITTSIGGQCGSTLFPRIENGVCKTFGDMVKEYKHVPLGSNLLSFVGHGALRKTVVGYENRKATSAELEQMKNLLGEAMENGALGISFGLIYTPSCYGDTKELIELSKVVKEYEGVVSAHIRNENFELIEAVEEFLLVIKSTDVRAVFSHHKAMHKENWGKVHTTLRMINEAVEEGYDIYCDVYPYAASSTSLAATVIAKELRNTDAQGIVKNVSDKKIRGEIKGRYIERYGSSLNNLLISSCKGLSEYEGMWIDEIAKIRNQGDIDAALDIIKDSVATAQICNFAMCEEDIETVIKYPRSMICTDSSVARENTVYHPRLRGSFPRALGRYVRERGMVTLPEMIRKMTSMPASVYSLPTKGILREGFDADICIFDADKIIDRADYINCSARCKGLSYVILGGEVVAEDAVYNGIRKGRFIQKEI